MRWVSASLAGLILNHRITESRNHSDLGPRSPPSPTLPWAGTSPIEQVPKAPSNLGTGAPTALIANNFLLASNRNLPITVLKELAPCPFPSPCGKGPLHPTNAMCATKVPEGKQRGWGRKEQQKPTAWQEQNPPGGGEREIIEGNR